MWVQDKAAAIAISSFQRIISSIDWIKLFVHIVSLLKRQIFLRCMCRSHANLLIIPTEYVVSLCCLIFIFTARIKLQYALKRLRSVIEETPSLSQWKEFVWPYHNSCEELRTFLGVWTPHQIIISYM